MFEGNPNFRQIIYFNIFARKFIFNFSETFRNAVDDNCEVFKDEGLSEPYIIAYGFKV